MHTLLQLQTRVIFSGHPKISTIFTNHITWCKKWSLKPFPCACHKIAPLLSIMLSVDNPHISVLGPNTTSSFDRVLHCNMNNTAVPNIRSFPEEFFTSFHTYYDEHVSHKFSDIFSCTPKYPILLFSKTKLSTNCIQLLMTSLCLFFPLLKSSINFLKNSPLTHCFQP